MVFCRRLLRRFAPTTIDMCWAVILSSASAERRIPNIIQGRCCFGGDSSHDTSGSERQVWPHVTILIIRQIIASIQQFTKCPWLKLDIPRIGDGWILNGNLQERPIYRTRDSAADGVGVRNDNPCPIPFFAKTNGCSLFFLQSAHIAYDQLADLPGERFAFSAGFAQ